MEENAAFVDLLYYRFRSFTSPLSRATPT